MGEIIIEVFGPWDEDVQRGFHDRWFDPDRVRIIQADGTDVGVLDHDDAEGYLARIEILPDWQGLGIGSSIIGDLLAAARARGGAIGLHAFTASPVMRLYERLGFRVVAAAENDRVFMLAD